MKIKRPSSAIWRAFYGVLAAGLLTLPGCASRSASMDESKQRRMFESHLASICEREGGQSELFELRDPLMRQAVNAKGELFMEGIVTCREMKSRDGTTARVPYFMLFETPMTQAQYMARMSMDKNVPIAAEGRDLSSVRWARDNIPSEAQRQKDPRAMERYKATILKGVR